jgi:hypothetical protein
VLHAKPLGVIAANATMFLADYRPTLDTSVHFVACEYRRRLLLAGCLVMLADKASGNVGPPQVA